MSDLKRAACSIRTVVHWGGEMGRLPVIQNDAGPASVGRDHNTYGFTMWLAGGGFKGGMAYGATDDFGHHAVQDVVNHYDYHATLLHLFGLDHQRLDLHAQRPGDDADRQPVAPRGAGGAPVSSVDAQKCV